MPITKAKAFQLVLIFLAVSPALHGADAPATDKTFGKIQSIKSIAFSPDSRLIAVAGGKDWTAELQGSTRGMLTVWEIDSGKEVLAVPDLPHEVGQVAFSPDGKTLAAACGIRDYVRPNKNKGAVLLWDLETGKERKVTLQGSLGAMRTVAFTPDGKQVIGGGASAGGKDPQVGVLCVWDFEKGKLLYKLFGHGVGHQITSLAVNADASRFVSGATDGKLIVWDVAKKKAELAAYAHTKAITRLALDGDHKVITNGEDKTTNVWDLNKLPAATVTGKQAWPQPIKTYSGSPDDGSMGLAIDAKLGLLATGGHVEFKGNGRPTGQVKFYSTVSEESQIKPIASLELALEGPLVISISPDGKWLAAGSNWNNTARLWQLDKILPKRAK